MRLLAAIRLSSDTDETTSPARQRASIEAFARAGGHTVAAVTEDLDVSGAIPPADRPQLGPWMRRTSAWDCLIASRLDRLSRSVADFATLLRELDGQGKHLVILDPMLDFSSPAGRAFAQVLSVFAEFERETIRQRVKEAYDHIRQAGAYPGMTIPFGYRVARRGRRLEYELDPQYAPVVREMAGRVLAGQSLRSVAIWLNDSGVPTSRNLQRRRGGKPERPSQWRAEQVKGVLLSPAIIGLQADTDGRPLHGPDGLPVRRCEGILSRETWGRVKAAMGSQDHQPHRSDANPLLRIAFCPCGAPLYGTASGKGARYYRCRDHRDRCRSRSVPADLLEDAAEELFLAAAGEDEITERVPVPAEDHSAEIAECDEGIAHLDAEYRAGRLHARAYGRVVSSLEERRELLLALPSRPAGHELVPAGETFRQRWQRAGGAERRRLMLAASFRVMARRYADGSIFVLSLGDAGLALRMHGASSGEDQEPAAWPGLAADLGYPLRAVRYGPQQRSRQ